MTRMGEREGERAPRLLVLVLAYLLVAMVNERPVLAVGDEASRYSILPVALHTHTVEASYC